MKPLTIEELKALEVGDWMWVIDINELGRTKGTYREIYDIIGDEVLLCGNVYGMRRYTEYGTKWIAYKNKEQAEAKGDIEELKRIRIGDTIYKVVSNCYECEDIEDYCHCIKMNTYKLLKITVNCISRSTSGYIFSDSVPGCVGYGVHTCYESYYGKEWFIEEKQAEARLQELRGEK